MIDGVTEEDVLMVVGNYNARAGSSKRQEVEEDMWSDVRGCHGVGQVNENGEALFSWCALNSL